MRLKGILTFILLLLLVCNLSAQEIAVTERGDTVMLYGNGTWDYLENITEEESIELKLNETIFVKPESATSRYKGKDEYFELWYDSSIWKRIPATNNPDVDVMLQIKGEDAYCMVINEGLEIGTETLADIAIVNAQNASTEKVKIYEKEYRIVNSDTLVSMMFGVKAQGVQFSYYAYYFSNSYGSTQVITFTGKSLMEKYKDKFTDLLNGFFAKKEDE